MRRLDLPLLLLLAASASAQATTELRPGVRVRVAAPGIVAGQLIGTVLSRTVDSIAIGSPETPPISIAFARIHSLEIDRGKGRSAGSLIGALIGRREWAAFDLPAKTSLHIRGGRPEVGLAFSF